MKFLCNALLVLVFGISLTPPNAQAAADFGVQPLRVDLSKARTNGSIRLKNNADTPVVVQIDAVSWSQPDGRDTLKKTTEIIVSPPLFKLAPKSGQTIRVGFTGKPDATLERTFRLLVREVPEKREGTVAIQTLLQLSLPVFVAALKPAEPKLEWTLAKKDAGHFVLEVKNSGLRHALFSDLGFEPRIEPENARALSGYVLPGVTRRWVWPITPPAPDTVTLQYVLDRNTVRLPLSPGGK